MSAAYPLIAYPDAFSPLAGCPTKETKGRPGDDLGQNNDQSNDVYQSEALACNAGC